MTLDLNLTTTQPLVSIIIPTHNRKESLKELLDSILFKMTHSQPFEVIVVCDGCMDGSVEMVKELSEQYPILKGIEKAGEGPAKARNAGVSFAQGSIIAFTDDDCLVTKDWMDEIISAFEDKKLVGLQGRTSTYEKECTPLTHQINNQHGSPSFPTCNVAVRKEAFEKIGGFDEAFPFAHNEDADLAWRLEKIGRLKFIPSMEIIHPPRPEKLSKMMKRMKILESEFLLYYKNKEAYRKKRAENPWVNIYWEMFFKHIPLSLKSRAKFIFKPNIFFKGVIINISWWLSILYMFPNFLIADKKYRRLAQEIDSQSKKKKMATS